MQIPISYIPDCSRHPYNKRVAQTEPCGKINVLFFAVMHRSIVFLSLKPPDLLICLWYFFKSTSVSLFDEGHYLPLPHKYLYVSLCELKMINELYCSVKSQTTAGYLLLQPRFVNLESQFFFVGVLFEVVLGLILQYPAYLASIHN